MSKIKLKLPENVKRIHCVGIGGAGMFPIVQILHHHGYEITGSDNNDSAIVELERQMGIDVSIGHSAENVVGADLIMYTDALLDNNVEIEHGKKLGIELWERAKILGVISSRFDHAIGVCGTHGKTTTTAMIAHMLYEGKTSPSAVIGGKLACIKGYATLGTSQNFVYEACEYKDHFLQTYPDTVVLLNIDDDHMEYFGNIENAIKSYTEFCNMASVIIYNGDDANVRKAIDDIDNKGEKTLLSFGFGENNDYIPAEITHMGGVTQRFELQEGEYGDIMFTPEISVPGNHNILNAVAAMLAARQCGMKLAHISQTIRTFTGVGRRFEYLGCNQESKVVIMDDYAHHPTEVTAVLTSTKSFDYKKVYAVFQPFTFTRTEMLLDEFAAALSIADQVIITPIMGGRETNKTGITSQDLADKIPGAVVVDGFKEAAEYINTNGGAGDLAITLGCGDIYKCAAMMLYS